MKLTNSIKELFGAKKKDMKLKVALVGIGYWGFHYARLISNHPDCELSMICDLNQEHLDTAKEAYPNVIVTKDINDVIKSKCEAVIVCTPVKTHFDIVSYMMISKKHILCEKAFTKNVDEAQALVNENKFKNLKIEIGHTYIFNSIVQEIKQILDDKLLGDIYYVAMTRVGMSPIRPDCNAIWDLGTHDISMLIYWFGMPTEVSSFGESYLQDGLEDFVVTNLKFKNKVIANIKNSWINPVKRRYVTIVGSEGMLVFDDIEKSLCRYDKAGFVGKSTAPPNEPLKEQVDDFIDSIISNREPLVTGQDGFNVVRVLEACQTSLKNNSEKITL